MTWKKSKKKFVGLKVGKSSFKGLKVGKRTTKNPFETTTYLKLKDSVHDVEYETVKLPYTIEAEYIPDFKVVTKSHQRYYLETKGNGHAWTADVRRKMLLVKKKYPEIDMRILFYSNGVFGPSRKDGSRMTQSEWAEKHGFTYAIKHIPEDWLI